MGKQLLFILLLVSTICSGQFTGSRNEALAKSFTTQKDIFSASKNIANLSQLTNLNIGLASKNNFLVKELQQSILVIGFPIFKGSGAFSIYRFGYQLYNELHIAFAYALVLSPSLSLGLKINYNHIIIRELNSFKSSIFPDIGLNYKVNKHIEFGLVLTNLTLSKISDSAIGVWPSTANIGLQYAINKNLKMFLETMFGVQSRLNIKYGIEYRVQSLFSILFGIQSHPSTFSFGIGINLKRLKIDLSSSYHSFLGFSPSLSLRFEAFN